MIPIIGGLLATLANAGMNLLGGAIEAKGKEFVENKLGVKIPNNPTPEDLFKLKQLEFDHEQILLELSIEKQKIELDLVRELAEVDKNENDNVSRRWEADMSSDSWLSKNIRPFGLLFVFFCILVIIILSSFHVKIDDGVFALVSTIGSLIVGAYYGGRSIEKVMHIKGKGKE